MDSKTKDERVDALYEAILTLKTVDECYRFFDDLCTIPEIREMSKRLLAAKRLNENKIYTEIVSETGLSSATISRVNRCLNYGSGGYRIVLDRLDEKSGDD